MNRSQRTDAARIERKAPETLADLGEWELIRRLGAFAPAGQFSDDAALLTGRQEDQGVLVVNTDVLVEGIHFSEVTTGPSDVGWRATAANLSDLAAMGASEVVGLTVGLVAPSSTRWSWVEGVYQGIAACLRAHGGVLLGGDCSGGTQRLLAITALGRLPDAGGPIRRAQGRPGDRLVSTGPHGLSRLGLALLQGTAEAKTMAGLDAGLIGRAITAHQRPRPRFDAVRTLHASQPAETAWRVGGCDSSDGLGAAVAAIATASGCAAQLDRRALPLDAAMAVLPQAQDWCLNGGEDFELVLALESSWAETFVAALPGSSLIGELMTGSAGALGWSDGGSWPAEISAASGGYQHFH